MWEVSLASAGLFKSNLVVVYKRGALSEKKDTPYGSSDKKGRCKPLLCVFGRGALKAIEVGVDHLHTPHQVIAQGQDAFFDFLVHHQA